MMTKLAVVAFGVTTAVLVPTTMHVLEAGPNQIAKLVAPDQQSVQIGDARVDISVDHGLVAAGGTIHVTVTATADKREQVPLAMLVYESRGVPDERVELPPARVGREEVTLDVAHGKATRTVAFTLDDDRPRGMSHDTYNHYTVLVMTPKAADLLDRKRRGASGIDPGGQDPNGFWALLEKASSPGNDGNEKAGGIARLDVTTSLPNDHISIVAGDVGRTGEDLAVKVRVRNTTRTAIDNVNVSLSAQSDGRLSDYQGLGSDQVAIDSPPAITLAPHETKDVVFHVTAQEAGTLGLFASVECECALRGSVLDAVDIVPADPNVAAR
jgi:hypothetical protein